MAIFFLTGAMLSCLSGIREEGEFQGPGSGMIPVVVRLVTFVSCLVQCACSNGEVEVDIQVGTRWSLVAVHRLLQGKCTRKGEIETEAQRVWNGRFLDGWCPGTFRHA